MACRVGRQLLRDSCNFSQLLQLTVVIAQRGLVLPIGILSVGTDYREHILSCFVFVAVDYGSHRRLNAHGEPLPRLAAHVAEPVATDVVAPQKSNVDKRHPTRAIAEQKDVARQSQRLLLGRQRPVKQLGEHRLWHSQLARGAHSCEHFLERHNPPRYAF